jgi:hypothetical protein
MDGAANKSAMECRESKSDEHKPLSVADVRRHGDACVKRRYGSAH